MIILMVFSFFLRLQFTSLGNFKDPMLIFNLEIVIYSCQQLRTSRFFECFCSTGHRIDTKAKIVLGLSGVYLGFPLLVVRFHYRPSKSVE